ncbi:MAG: calcium-binding protein [Peptococcaceae bacterium]|jgi:DNA-directed RNA polymerase subunit RPC12/RpoP|nr:calcium-binding protein [Peptococcaceae bacterium]
MYANYDISGERLRYSDIHGGAVVKLSKEKLRKMNFDDTVDPQEPGDYDEEDCCGICGNKFENLKISRNAKEQLYKYECANCGAIFVTPENSAKTERVLLQGEARNWPEYLLETLKFPFNANIIESNDREFFDPDYDGPSLYDTVKVLEVFYSMKYGVEALVRKSRRTYQQILCFMEAADYDTRNYDELENYKRWREKYWLSDFLVALVEARKEAKKEARKEAKEAKLKQEK